MMKKVTLILFTIFIGFVLVACTSNAISETPMASNQDVATLSYISSGFIDAEVALLEEEDNSSIKP